MTTIVKTTQGVQNPWILKFAVIKKDFKKRKMVYLMALPVIAFYIIFQYWPMYGAIIAFENFNPVKGILHSPWVGFQHFQSFFSSYYLWRLLKNTILISVYDLIFGFPAPIILALLLNEIRRSLFKRSIQTITYLPHFVSTVVMCGIILDFLSQNGVINSIILLLGGKPVMFLLAPEWFRTIYVGSGIWQHVGWNSIIYLATLASINPQLYEAAIVDGAGRFKQVVHITIPGIMPTIVILLILAIGSMMDVGFEKVMLLYNPSTYSTADVISTFVYRKGLLESDFSYSSAIGLFNSVINFTLLILANKASRVIQETSLW